MSLRCN